MNPGNAAEKISDLFQVTLNELETNIVSQAIKMSHQPQKLVELSVVEFKQRFYESLQHLLQFIAQICGTNGKEVLRIAQLMEQQVNKFKQQQLLVQMKSVVNQKLKALMETMHIDNKGQKQEVNQQLSQIEIQIKLLSESLHKIEYTLQIEQNQQFNTPQYITPYPKKNFCTASSVDQMTPNLSEEAERRGRGFMVTPDQLRPQEPRQFEHSQHPSSSKDSVQQDKTMNSFHNDMHHTLDFQSDQQQLIDNDSAPHFGIDQQQQTRFQNEIMDEYFSKVPIYTSLHSQLEQINTTRTEQAQTLVENVSIVEQSNEITQSQPNYRKQSTQSVVNQKQSSSPKVKRLINTSKSKESISRCKTTMDSTNLMTKLNSAADLTRITKKPSMSRVNKENLSQPINKQPLQKSSKPIMITKPKSLVVKKDLQVAQLKKSSTK